MHGFVCVIFPPHLVFQKHFAPKYISLRTTSRGAPTFTMVTVITCDGMCTEIPDCVVSEFELISIALTHRLESPLSISMLNHTTLRTAVQIMTGAVSGEEISNMGVRRLVDVVQAYQYLGVEENKIKALVASALTALILSTSPVHLRQDLGLTDDWNATEEQQLADEAAWIRHRHGERGRTPPLGG